MPIRKVVKEGRTLWQWGTQGRLYTNRIDAIRQGQAAHAAGFKEPALTKTKESMK